MCGVYTGSVCGGGGTGTQVVQCSVVCVREGCTQKTGSMWLTSPPSLTLRLTSRGERWHTRGDGMRVSFACASRWHYVDSVATCLLKLLSASLVLATQSSHFMRRNSFTLPCSSRKFCVEWVGARACVSVLCVSVLCVSQFVSSYAGLGALGWEFGWIACDVYGTHSHAPFMRAPYRRPHRWQASPAD